MSHMSQLNFLRQPRMLSFPRSKTERRLRRASIIGVSICLLLLMVTTVSAQIGKAVGCTVRGRAIDDDGLPVADAIILIDAGTPKGWEDLIITDRSSTDGKFSYSVESCPFPEESRTLYLTSKINYDNEVPFSAPFRGNQKAGIKFAGQTIKSKTKGDTDLGDVRVQVFFTTVLIFFQDESGKPLIPSNRWKDFWFKLKTKDGITISEGGISQHTISHAVRVIDSALAMDLPEGTWLIEMIDPSENNGWLKPDALITVPRKASPIEVSLRMSKKN